MARPKYIEVSVFDWLNYNQGSPIQVADYQRPYCWNENQVTVFTESVLQSLLHETAEEVIQEDLDSKLPFLESPDIGVIVIEKISRGGEVIADGQQRLLTFALIAFEAKLWREKRSDAAENCKHRKRVDMLLRSACGNVSSLQNALAARKTIRRIFTKYLPYLSKYKNKKDLFKKITMGIAWCENSRNTDAYIIKLFEDINTQSKQLNGGQILKAEHLGKVLPRKFKPSTKVKQRIYKTHEVQYYYEQWRKNFAKNDDLNVDELKLKCLNNRKQISLELFIDSPGEEAWEKLGPGFVQAVQAILLKQGQWWIELSAQTSQRLQPFERLMGAFEQQLVEKEEWLPEFIWSARSPAAIPYGDGFFQTVNRLAVLYDDYYQRLVALIDKADPHECTAGGQTSATQNYDSRSLTTPGSLVCEAAQRLAAFCKRIEEWLSSADKQLDETYLQQFIDDKNRAVLRQKLINPAAWLAIDELTGEVKIDPNTGKEIVPALPTVHGGIPTALFAVALCWHDRFGKPLKATLHPRERFARKLSNAEKEAILHVLIYQLLSSKLQKQSRSVLLALRLEDAVSAAEFSDDVQGALWKFINTTPTSGNKNLVLFFRALADAYSNLQSLQSTRNSSNKDNEIQDCMDEDLLVLNVLSSYLNAQE